MGKNKDSKERRLTLKQTRFINNYLINGGNAAQAYRESYDTKATGPKRSAVEARRLMRLPHIANAIEERLQAQETSLEDIVLMLQSDRKLAHDHAQAGAAGAITMHIAKSLRLVDGDGPSVQVNVVASRTNALMASLSSEKLQAIASLAEAQVDPIDSTDVLDNGDS